MMKNVLTGKKTIGEAAAETRELMERLRTFKIGESIAYSELSRICGEDVQRRGRSRLNSARRIMEREDRMVFGVEKNVGLVRLADPEIVRGAASSSEHIRRTAKRELVKQAAVNGERLDQTEKMLHQGVIIQNTYIIAVARRSLLNRAVKLIASGNATPGSVETLLRPQRLLPARRKKTDT